MRKRHYTGFWRQRAIIQMASFVGLLLPLTGCNDREVTHQESTSGTPAQDLTEKLSVARLLELLGERVEGAQGGVQGALGPQGEVIQEKTKQEVEKLFQWEYKVIDLPLGLTAASLEERLAELGRDGWECFSMTPTPTETRTTCKRRPKSAIAYLKLLPGL